MMNKLVVILMLTTTWWMLVKLLAYFPFILPEAKWTTSRKVGWFAGQLIIPVGLVTLYAAGSLIILSYLTGCRSPG